jgi:hypothetical protein
MEVPLGDHCGHRVRAFGCHFWRILPICHSSAAFAAAAACDYRSQMALYYHLLMALCCHDLECSYLVWCCLPDWHCGC